jgi:hypothetical protein
MHAKLPSLTSIALFAVGVFSVIAASATAPPGRYVISNGTVYDTKTKLTWQQTPPSFQLNLADAGSAGIGGYCASLGARWRLPTWEELITIMDYSQTSAPLLDPTAFPAPQPSGTYFTANSLCIADTSNGSGGCGACDGSPRFQAYVRCVK